MMVLQYRSQALSINLETRVLLVKISMSGEKCVTEHLGRNQASSSASIKRFTGHIGVTHELKNMNTLLGK